MESGSICNNKERQSLGEQGMFHFSSVLFCLLGLIKFSLPPPHTAYNNQRTMEDEKYNGQWDKVLLHADLYKAGSCNTHLCCANLQMSVLNPTAIIGCFSLYPTAHYMGPQSRLIPADSFIPGQ